MHAWGDVVCPLSSTNLLHPRSGLYDENTHHHLSTSEGSHVISATGSARPPGDIAARPVVPRSGLHDMNRSAQHERARYRMSTFEEARSNNALHQMVSASSSSSVRAPVGAQRLVHDVSPHPRVDYMNEGAPERMSFPAPPHEFAADYRRMDYVPPDRTAYTSPGGYPYDRASHRDPAYARIPTGNPGGYPPTLVPQRRPASHADVAQPLSKRPRGRPPKHPGLVPHLPVLDRMAPHLPAPGIHAGHAVGHSFQQPYTVPLPPPQRATGPVPMPSQLQQPWRPRQSTPSHEVAQRPIKPLLPLPAVPAGGVVVAPPADVAPPTSH